MELSDIITVVSMPVGFLTGLNMKAYEDTKNELATHKIDSSWNEQFYKRFRDRSLRGYLSYYLGIPGRQIAYRSHSKNNLPID